MEKVVGVELEEKVLTERFGESQKDNIVYMVKFLLENGYCVVGEKTHLGTPVIKRDGSSKVLLTASEEGKPLAIKATEYSGNELNVISSRDENGEPQIMTKVVVNGVATFYCAILGTGGRIKRLSITTTDSKTGKRETKIVPELEIPSYSFQSLTKPVEEQRVK